MPKVQPPLLRRRRPNPPRPLLSRAENLLPPPKPLQTSRHPFLKPMEAQVLRNHRVLRPQFAKVVDNVRPPHLAKPRKKPTCLLRANAQVAIKNLAQHPPDKKKPSFSFRKIATRTISAFIPLPWYAGSPKTIMLT